MTNEQYQLALSNELYGEYGMKPVPPERPDFSEVPETMVGVIALWCASVVYLIKSIWFVKVTVPLAARRNMKRYNKVMQHYTKWKNTSGDDHE